MTRSKGRRHDEGVGAAQTLAAEEPTPRFITCLVTPKICFSLPRRQEYATVSDISQEDLRKAFLSRFPMEFDVDRVVFTPALAKQPTGEGIPARVVFKMAVRGDADGGNGGQQLDDERVLLDILQTLDRAYAERHKRQIESARAEMLASTMSFEVMADEIRKAQEDAARETHRLKDQASSSQKRLYLLELEKEQLQAARLSSESSNEALRKRVDVLSAENAHLRDRIDGLTERLDALAGVVSGVADKIDPRTGSGAEGARTPRANTETQTSGAAPPDLVASMSEWLRQGSRILEASTGSGVEPQGAISPPPPPPPLQLDPVEPASPAEAGLAKSTQSAAASESPPGGGRVEGAPATTSK
mmetsp:Transcript_4236/g.11947  ORF Transcript_4236/g.11947 Transcript_4236/m.11947 type:complete len:359 (+) Transcript_4236:55-1131(+)